MGVNERSFILQCRKKSESYKSKKGWPLKASSSQLGYLQMLSARKIYH